MRIPYTFLFILLSMSAFGQLKDGTIAPDFTATDINGVEHNLYELLDEGKTVILDMFATWCGPCWSYHQGHTLADIYEKYGPDGTDEMFVFAIEADNSTNVDCIYGPNNCNDSTIGDWTAGTPYPIIDNVHIGNDYDISYYPTIYMVYPNRIVHEIGQISESDIEEWKADSPQLTTGTHIDMIYFKGQNGSVCLDLWASAPYYVISNMGTDTITSAKIVLESNGEAVYEEDWMGEVGPYGILKSLQINPSIVSKNTVYEIYVKDINGVSGENLYFKSSITLDVQNTIYLDIHTDANSAADNNRYEILDRDGIVLKSVDINENNTHYTTTHYLTESECHEIVFYDDAGDGIDGEITVTDYNGFVIYENDGFETEVSTNFFVDVVSGVEENFLQSAQISPNPASDELQVQFDMTQQGNVQIKVINAEGKYVYQENYRSGANQAQFHVIDISNWVSGLYYLQLVTKDENKTMRFVKN